MPIAEVKRFVDSFQSVGDLDTAFEIVKDCSPSEAYCDLADHAMNLGYVFTPAEGKQWIDAFRSDVHDSYLRFELHKMRLRQPNDWAAFFALERAFRFATDEHEMLDDAIADMLQPSKDMPEARSRWLNFRRILYRLRGLLGWHVPRDSDNNGEPKIATETSESPGQGVV